LPSVLSDGLKPGIDGVTYFANTSAYAAGFLAMRGKYFDGIKEVVVGGQSMMLPNIIMPPNIYVVEVDTSRISADRIGYGGDHAARFFPADLIVYTYEDFIPSTAISNAWSYDNPMHNGEVD